MNKEQALQAIQNQIASVKDREDRLQVVGYIKAVLDFGLIDYVQASQLTIEAMGVRL
ncbi:hypothetical protein [Acinetobacter towneri]|uniref:hypothetical protein n=1 Tax=Acinetobacter towneri TaxID=202956 RepID=UPI00336C0C99